MGLEIVPDFSVSIEAEKKVYKKDLNLIFLPLTMVLSTVLW